MPYWIDDKRLPSAFRSKYLHVSVIDMLTRQLSYSVEVYWARCNIIIDILREQIACCAKQFIPLESLQHYCVYLSMFMFNKLQRTAEELIRHSGGRVTAGRIRILSVLLAEQQAITHREIEQRLPQTLQLDRVTLYRALEWLADKNLIHKVTSDDRAWRYHANRELHTHQHAHFKCTRCAQVICLSDLSIERSWPLPIGYRFQEIELTVKGLCADCS